jgi:hypothetical protein
MARINLDGVDVEVAPEYAPLVQAYVRDSSKALTELRTANSTLQEKLDTLQSDFSDLEAEKEIAEGRADGLQATIDTGEPSEIHLDEDNIDAVLAQIPASRLDTLVAARLDTLQLLAPTFEDDFVFDGIEADELYVQAYENIFGEAPDEEMEVAQMRGRVEGALATLDAEDPPEAEPAPRTDAADSTGKLRTALRGVQRRDAAASSDSYKQKTNNSWQKPLTASKRR